MSEVLQLPIGNVHPDPENPRSNLGDLTELEASVIEHGVLEPVLVRDHPEKKGQWMIVAGHRRHAAAFLAGKKTIPSLVIDLGDTETVVLQLVENLQRADLAPIDEAKALQRLIDLGLKQREIAKRISRSPGHVSKRLTLLELPDSAAKMVADGSIKVDDAYQLAAALKTEGIDRDGLVESVVETAKDRRGVASDLSHWISYAAEQAKTEASRIARVEEFTTQGDKELESTSGARRVDQYELDLNVNKHRKEPCARFRIVRSWGSRNDGWKPEWWCAEPARHSPKGDSVLKAKEAVRSPNGYRMSAAEKRREAETARRLANYPALVEGMKAARPSVPATLVHRQTALIVLNMLSSQGVAHALEMMGADFKKSATRDIKVAQLREEFEKQPLAASLAVSIAWAEERTYPWLDHPDHCAHQFISAIGAGEQATLVEEEELEEAVV